PPSPASGHGRCSRTPVTPVPQGGGSHAWWPAATSSTRARPRRPRSRGAETGSGAVLLGSGSEQDGGDLFLAAHHARHRDQPVVVALAEGADDRRSVSRTHQHVH